MFLILLLFILLFNFILVIFFGEYLGRNSIKIYISFLLTYNFIIFYLIFLLFTIIILFFSWVIIIQHYYMFIEEQNQFLKIENLVFELTSNRNLFDVTIKNKKINFSLNQQIFDYHFRKNNPTWEIFSLNDSHKSQYSLYKRLTKVILEDILLYLGLYHTPYQLHFIFVNTLLNLFEGLFNFKITKSFYFQTMFSSIYPYKIENSQCYTSIEDFIKKYNTNSIFFEDNVFFSSVCLSNITLDTDLLVGLYSSSSFGQELEPLEKFVFLRNEALYFEKLSNDVNINMLQRYIYKVAACERSFDARIIAKNLNLISKSSETISNMRDIITARQFFLLWEQSRTELLEISKVSEIDLELLQSNHDNLYYSLNHYYFVQNKIHTPIYYMELQESFQYHYNNQAEIALACNGELIM